MKYSRRFIHPVALVTGVVLVIVGIAFSIAALGDLSPRSYPEAYSDASWASALPGVTCIVSGALRT